MNYICMWHALKNVNLKNVLLSPNNMVQNYDKLLQTFCTMAALKMSSAVGCSIVYWALIYYLNNIESYYDYHDAKPYDLKFWEVFIYYTSSTAQWLW